MQPPMSEEFPHGLSEALTALAWGLRETYRGTFVFNQLGDHLLKASAFCVLTRPYLPSDLARDADLLRQRFDRELQDTLAVCILSIDDVTDGPPMDESQQRYSLTPVQHENVWSSHPTAHFSDTVCDTVFWTIVDEIRRDIGLDAPSIG